MNQGPPSNVWRGERVQLHALGQEDFEAAEAGTLLPDSDAERSEDRLHFPFSNAQHRAQLEHLASREGKGDDFFWVVRDLQGNRVGTINTFDCDARVGTFKYGVAIYHDQRRKGYAREAIALVLRYYFHELRYQKVTAIVYAFNAASQRLHERLGFQLEGRLRRMVYTQGQHHDELYFGFTREEYDALYSPPL
jgi:RimJ/RimL family protein N-acetyltransferase